MTKKIIGWFVVALVLLPTAIFATVGGETNTDENTNDIRNVEVFIEKPRNGFLYVRNREIVYMGATIIIGPRHGIEVIASVDPEQQGNVTHIEFYINGRIAGIGSWDPFRQYYTWRCTDLGFGVWHLTARAVVEGQPDSSNMDVNSQQHKTEGVTMLYFNFRMLQPKM